MPRCALALLLLALLACDGDGPTQPPPPPGAALFAIRACADGSRPGEVFRVLVEDPAVIAEATALVGAGNRKIVTGRLLAGDGGFNRGWRWHLDPDSIGFYDATIELCDGCPHDIEADLTYWLDSVGHYCPWSTEVLARER